MHTWVACAIGFIGAIIGFMAGYKSAVFDQKRKQLEEEKKK